MSGTPVVVRKLKFDGSVRYEWDVETRMSADAYARWVVISLRRHMDALATEPPQLVFARYTGGDRLRLRLLLEAPPGGAHVHAVLTATPD